MLRCVYSYVECMCVLRMCVRVRVCVGVCYCVCVCVYTHFLYTLPLQTRIQTSEMLLHLRHFKRLCSFPLSFFLSHTSEMLLHTRHLQHFKPPCSFSLSFFFSHTSEMLLHARHFSSLCVGLCQRVRSQRQFGVGLLQLLVQHRALLPNTQVYIIYMRDRHSYGVALVSRIDKITGLFCKRAL